MKPIKRGYYEITFRGSTLFHVGNGENGESILQDMIYDNLKKYINEDNMEVIVTDIEDVWECEY